MTCHPEKDKHRMVFSNGSCFKGTGCPIEAVHHPREGTTPRDNDPSV